MQVHSWTDSVKWILIEGQGNGNCGGHHLVRGVYKVIFSCVDRNELIRGNSRGLAHTSVFGAISPFFTMPFTGHFWEPWNFFLFPEKYKGAKVSIICRLHEKTGNLSIVRRSPVRIYFRRLQRSVHNEETVAAQFVLGARDAIRFWSKKEAFFHSAESFSRPKRKCLCRKM